MLNPNAERIILGIDPGLATVGYGLIRFNGDTPEVIDYGTILTPKSLDFSERLLMIQRDLSLIVETHKPTEAFVEELFFSVNAKTAMSVAHARGVIMSSLASFGLHPRSLTPNQVKVGVTGHGAADKRQVQDMLKLQFGLESLPEPDDAADALAIALCGGMLAISSDIS